jgi:hypothetical protein
MSVTVLCQGCGGRVAVPDDYARARIRCPQCGVMCDLPAAAQKKIAAAKEAARPAADLDDIAAEALFGDGPPPARAESEPPPRRSEQIQPRPRKAEPPAVPPPAPYPTEYSNEDDGKPYFVPGLDEVRPCPSCHKEIPRDALLCTSCGYDRRTGKKVVQVFEPVDRTWQAGWPARVRWGLFLAGGGVTLPLVILGAVFKGQAFGWLFPWLLFAAMLAFLLGTYDRVRLTRNKKGRVRLTKTWAVCFLPRPPVEVDVHEYFGVTYGQAHDVHFMEWMVLVTGLAFLIVPGLLWYYFAIHRETYEAALTKAHGSDPFLLYRGHDQALARDIGEAVRDVAHLPLG